MARIRSVHPTLWTDEDFVQLSMAARLFLIGIWNEADDCGLFEWKPIRLKMRIAPADAVDAPALMDELGEAGFIVQIERDGKLYGAVHNFRKFQRPKNPSAPLIPLDDEIRGIVGLPIEGSPTPALPQPYPRASENPPQMEDGGGVRKEGRNTAGSEQEAPREPVPKDPAARRWTRKEIDEVESACRKAASVNGLSPAWPECSAIIGLIDGGYDLELDILPQIRAQTMRLGKPPVAPKYYVKGIREAADDRKRIAGERKPGSGPGDDEWRQRVARWSAEGKWSTARSWGPPPDAPGCIVPKHLLNEFRQPAAASG